MEEVEEKERDEVSAPDFDGCARLVRAGRTAAAAEPFRARARRPRAAVRAERDHGSNPGR